MTGGEMTCHSGAMLYSTNTDSVINLTGAALNLSDDGTLLIVSTGRWGKDGRNGGDCVLNTEDQELEGTIAVDAISTLELNMVDTTYTGVIEGEGRVCVTMDEGSTWMLTGDSYISEFNGDMGCVITNGFVLYVDGVAVTEG